MDNDQSKGRMDLDPKFRAALGAVAAAIDSGDDAALLGLLGGAALSARLDEVVPALAHLRPDLARRQVIGTGWPSSLADRCQLLMRDELASPYGGEEWLCQRHPPIGWNWLVSLAELIPDTEHLSARIEERRRLADRLNPSAVLDHLLTDARENPRLWSWFVAYTTVLQRESDDAAAFAQVEGFIEVAAASVPASIQAIALMRQACEGRAPQTGLRRRFDGAKPGRLFDIALAASLLGYANVSLLAKDLPERLVLLRELAVVAISANRQTKLWHEILCGLLESIGFEDTARPEQGAPGDNFGPAHAAFANALLALGHHVELQHPDHVVAQSAIIALLSRLRRSDLIAQLASARLTQGGASSQLVRTALPRSVRQRVAAATEDASTRNARTLRRFPVPPNEALVQASHDGTLQSSDISVCILNHNGSAATLRLITSLRRLWSGFEGNVLLLDNGSTDTDFATLSRHLGEAWPGRIRLFRSSVNQGVGPARNQLFQLATTPWILSLDNDMIAIADFGTELLPTVNPQGAFFNLAYEELDHPGVAGLGKAWSIDIDALGNRSFKTRYVGYGRRNQEELRGLRVRSNRLSGGSSLFQRKAFFDLGGFAEAYEIGFEDYEFSMRMDHQGFSVETPARALLVHGHTAPRHEIDLSSIMARFDAPRIARSRANFDADLRQAYQAADGRTNSAAPLRELPRRLDLRHAQGAEFFSELRPDQRSVAVIADGIDVRSVITRWSGEPVNFSVFDESEFPTSAYALLLTQAFDLVVGDDRLLSSISPMACAELGLNWRQATEAPLLIGLSDSHAAAAKELYTLGPQYLTTPLASEVSQLFEAHRRAD